MDNAVDDEEEAGERKVSTFDKVEDHQLSVHPERRHHRSTIVDHEEENYYDQWDEVMVYGSQIQELNGCFTRLGAKNPGKKEPYVYCRQLEDEAENDKDDRFYMFQCIMDVGENKGEHAWKISRLSSAEKAAEKPLDYLYFTLSDALNPPPVGWREFNSANHPITVKKMGEDYLISGSKKEKINGVFRKSRKGEYWMKKSKSSGRHVTYYFYNITFNPDNSDGGTTVWQMTKFKPEKAHEKPNSYVFRTVLKSEGDAPEGGWLDEEGVCCYVEKEPIRAERPVPMVEPRKWNQLQVKFAGRDDVNGHYERVDIDYERKDTAHTFFRPDLNKDALHVNFSGSFYFRQVLHESQIRNEEPYHIIYKMDYMHKKDICWVLARFDPNAEEGKQYERVYIATMRKKISNLVAFPPNFGWETNPALMEVEEEEEEEESVEEEKGGDNLDAEERPETAAEEEEEDSGEGGRDPKEDRAHPDWPPPTFVNMEEPFKPEYVLSFRVRNYGFKLQLNKDTIEMVHAGDENFTEESWRSIYDLPMQDAPIWPYSPADILKCIKNARLTYQLRLSHDGEHIFCFVSVDNLSSKRWAAYMDHDLLLDVENAIRIGRDDINFLLAKRTLMKGEKEEQFGLEFLIDGARVLINKFKEFICYRMCNCLLRCFCKMDDYFMRKGIVDFSCWERTYVQYNDMVREELFTRYKKDCETCGDDPVVKLDEPDYDDGSIFSPRHRLRIIFEMLTGECFDDPSLPSGAQVRVEELSMDFSHPLEATFPLHDKAIFHELEGDFNCPAIMGPSKSQFDHSLDEIRNYFGEEIAYYFAFIRKYNVGLVIPSIAGVIVFAAQLSQGKIALSGLSMFALFVIVWGVLFVEYWTSMEEYYRARWGMTRYERKALPRPQFEGQQVVSNINGKVVEDYEVLALHWGCVCFSYSAVFLCIMCVLTTVIAMFIWRNTVSDKPEFSILLGAMNAVQIQIFNVIYARISFWLNEKENHRLQPEYDQSMIWKKILFYVINSYSALFYIAFLKPEDSNTARLNELRLQLASLFATMIFVQNATELVINPIMDFIFSLIPGFTVPEYEVDDLHHTTLLQHKISDGDLQDAQDQIELYPAPELLDEMAELVIQYGYVTLFVIVFPLTPLLALINNFIEVQVDTYKWKTSQRPIPKGAVGIGEWNTILTLFSLAAVLSNIGLIAFYTENVKDLFEPSDEEEEDTLKVWYFGILSAVIYGLIVLSKYFGCSKMCVGTAGIEEHMARSAEIERNLVSKAVKPNPIFAAARVSTKTADERFWNVKNSKDNYRDPLTKRIMELEGVLGGKHMTQETEHNERLKRDPSASSHHIDAGQPETEDVTEDNATEENAEETNEIV